MPNKAPDYTYLIGIGSQYLKIGHSAHPGRRRFGIEQFFREQRMLQVANAELLAVVPSHVLSESQALAPFRHIRLEYLKSPRGHRREWFPYSDEIIAFFEEYRSAFVPQPWAHLCTFYWRDDPRHPASLHHPPAWQPGVPFVSTRELFRQIYPH